MAKNSRSLARERRHVRVRKNLAGTAERPRLNVFKSLSGIYAQVIDDRNGSTVASASTLEAGLREAGHEVQRRIRLRAAADSQRPCGNSVADIALQITSGGACWRWRSEGSRTRATGTAS